MRPDLARFSNQKGAVLITVTLVALVLLILGSIFLNRSINEGRSSEKNKKMMRAVYVAEAGLDRALYDLKADFDNGTTWDDGQINGLITVPNKDSYYSLPYTNTSLEDESYTVELKNIGEGTDNNGNGMADSCIWVKSTGIVDEVRKSIRVYVKAENISPWNNAIFSCGGASGKAVSGNVDIRGSVHVLGQDPFVDENGNGVYDAGESYTDILGDSVWGRALNSTDLAFDLGGTANIVGNNYSGMPAGLRSLVHDSPQTVFNGETVETLGAKLRVKYGQAGFSGSATAGQPNVSGNSYKETVDGVFISEGYAGTQGAANVYSDNGTSNLYRSEDEVRFPSLRDYYSDTSTAPATVYQTSAGGYQKYLQAKADVVFGGNLNMTPDSSTDFDYYDEGTGKGIKKVGGVLTVGGIIYIQGGLTIDKLGADKTFTYSGKASILSEGDVNINANLLTSGAKSYPGNIIGIMTPGNISFNEAGTNVMGIFYAENAITAQKQINVTGTFFSNYVDMGTNVPSIYHVPSVVDNLPAGMIANAPLWIVSTLNWQEVEE